MKSTASKTWNPTSVPNLLRHKSGRYYARVKRNGKQTWKALKTGLFEVARIKLREIVEFIAAIRKDGGRTSQDCKDPAEGLAYTGIRIAEGVR